MKDFTTSTGGVHTILISLLTFEIWRTIQAKVLVPTHILRTLCIAIRWIFTIYIYLYFTITYFKFSLSVFQAFLSLSLSFDCVQALATSSMTLPFSIYLR